MTASDEAPTTRGPRHPTPTRDEMRRTLDPADERFGQSWSSDQGWHEPVEDEGTVTLSRPASPGLALDEDLEAATLPRGSRAWLIGRELFRATMRGAELSAMDEFTALAYVNSRSQADIRDDVLFGMANEGDLAARYLKDQTLLGRLVDRVIAALNRVTRN